MIKKIWHDLRWGTAYWMVDLAMSVMPNDEEKTTFCRHVLDWQKEVRGGQTE